MKRVFAMVLSLLMLCTALAAGAEGLLPTFDEAFSVAMPNMENALGRRADATETPADGSTLMTFRNIGETEYEVCNVYLGGSGCTVESVNIADGKLTAQLGKEGYTLTFLYDRHARTLVLTYPDGARPETYVPMKVGEYVTFGHYEQDNKTTNGAEPVEWRVLTVEDGRALLVSRYGLDYGPSGSVNVSAMIKWLNKDFLNAAFTEDEQAGILTTTLTADGNSASSTSSGGVIQEKMILLSVEEVEKYFASDAARACKPTAYATAQGVYKSSGSYARRNCWWWILMTFSGQHYVTRVDVDGSVYRGHDAIVRVSPAIRPAMWVDLDAEIFNR
ncbi:MAG: hypothetical protein IJ343_07450 [Clostridia bacterium]|nr:hypothetical protein [Clostridia bacterium]